MKWFHDNSIKSLKKRVCPFLFLLLSYTSICYGVEYEQHMSTYYLVPLGVYESLYLKPKGTIGPDPCKVGTMYFDFDGNFSVCQEDVSGTGSWDVITVWEESSNHICLADLDLSVGIGTETPSSKLSLVGNGAILAEGTFGTGGEVLTTSGAGTRMLWYPRKGVFRAGQVTNENWDDTNIGNYSFAVGRNTIAFGDASTSMGSGAVATGDYSTTFGKSTTSWYGNASTVFGISTVAYGDNSMALGGRTAAVRDASIATGYESQAQGLRSVAMGNQSLASDNDAIAIGEHAYATATSAIAMGTDVWSDGDYSIAMGAESETGSNYSIAMGYQAQTSLSDYNIALGNQAQSSGESAVSMGHLCTSEGDFSISMGSEAKAAGQYSLAIGKDVEAQAYSSLAVGEFNKVEGDTHTWVDTDPLFVVGNGTDAAHLHNALTVLKNGNMGVGTNTPESSLSVPGIPIYADNVAAVAAGLSAGAFYQTGGVLKVVH